MISKKLLLKAAKGANKRQHKLDKKYTRMLLYRRVREFWANRRKAKESKMDNIKNKLNKTLSYASLLALTIAAVYGGWSLIEQVNNVWILRGAVVLLAGFLVEQVLRLNRK